MQFPNHGHGKLDTLSQNAYIQTGYPIMHCINEAAEALNSGQADTAI